MKIAILGSTGSIGTQALELARLHSDWIEIIALSAQQNAEHLCRQAWEFRPRYVALADEQAAASLKAELPPQCEMLCGPHALEALCALPEVERVLIAVVGIAGLPAVLASIRHGKDIALANKEALVTGGALVKRALQAQGVSLYPVDSEHSAILQALAGKTGETAVSRVILTASGGPFRGYSQDQLRSVTLEQALRHPNWSMGQKITIDSATMMNKGLEVIEAHWLFDMPPEQIEVVVHPQSVIHSMVEYEDGSVIAQMGEPDMRIPILYALTFPHRKRTGVPRLNFQKTMQLDFQPADLACFPCLGLAYRALETGGTMPVVLNAANEMAVASFLEGRIAFLDIPRLIECCMNEAVVVHDPVIDDIYTADEETRHFYRQIVRKGGV